MAPAKSPLCSAFLLLCVVIQYFQRVEAQCGGFRQSCTNFGLDTIGAIFMANCYWKDGHLGFAELSLDQNIGNTNGQLVDGAGFFESCQDLGWYAAADPNGGLFLKANCRDSSGNLQLSSYDLNRRITNNNGYLYFNNCRRRSLLDATLESSVANNDA